MPEHAWRIDLADQLTIAGKSLEIFCCGPAPGAAPTLVLLHEGLGCVALWRDFPQRLAAHTGCGVLAYSRAGYGASDPTELPRPLDYMNREAINVLPLVLDAAGIRKAVLLGHSDGATIAAIHAGSVASRRVRGLILIAPHFFAERCGLAAIEEAKVAYQTTGLRDKLARYHQHVDNAFHGWCNAWLDADFAHWNVADNLDYLRVPILAIQGTDDQYGTLAQINEIEQRCYAPVETLVIPDCQHSPHTEHPEQTLGAITDFVARLRAMEGL